MRIIWLAALAIGCGYQPIRGDDGRGPVSAVRLGSVFDQTAEGDLGITARSLIHERLSRGKRPALKESAQYTLSGVVRIAGDHPVGYDRDRVAAVYEVVVVVELFLLDSGPTAIEAPAAFEAVWTTGPVSRGAVYNRSATPLETLGARRRAIVEAMRAAVEDGLAGFLASPSLE